MVRLKLGLPLLLFMASGCGTTHDVRSWPSGGAALSAVNAEASKRSAIILLVDGSRFSASGIAVGPDSTVWQADDRGVPGGVLTSAVSTITFKKRLKGAIKGVVVGAGIGALLGYASGDSDAGLVGVPAEAKAAAGSAILGTVGLLAGLVSGHQDVYEFGERPREQRSEEEDPGG